MFQLALINGATLKRLRVIRGVSEDFLAAKVRISITQLRGWEHGDPGDFRQSIKPKLWLMCCFAHWRDSILNRIS